MAGSQNKLGPVFSWADEVEKEEAAQTQVNDQQQKPNPFGSARPREIVLQEKGIDWRKLDQDLHRNSNSRYNPEKDKPLKENIPATGSLRISNQKQPFHPRRKAQQPREVPQVPLSPENYVPDVFVPPLRYPPKNYLLYSGQGNTLYNYGSNDQYNVDLDQHGRGHIHQHTTRVLNQHGFNIEWERRSVDALHYGREHIHPYDDYHDQHEFNIERKRRSVDPYDDYHDQHEFNIERKRRSVEALHYGREHIHQYNDGLNQHEFNIERRRRSVEALYYGRELREEPPIADFGFKRTKFAEHNRYSNLLDSSQLDPIHNERRRWHQYGQVEEINGYQRNDKDHYGETGRQRRFAGEEINDWERMDYDNEQPNVDVEFVEAVGDGGRGKGGKNKSGIYRKRGMKLKSSNKRC